MSGATYDFALLGYAAIDFGALARVVTGIPDDLKLPPELRPELALYGRASAGEIAVMLRFPFAAYSAALRRRMEQEAARLKTRLVELPLLKEAERGRFWDRLATFDVQPEPAEGVEAAIHQFRARMGVLPAGDGHPAVKLAYESGEEILSAYARFVAEGSLRIPVTRGLSVGSSVRLIFVASDTEPMEAGARVLSVGESASEVVLEPSPVLKEFVATHARKKREGRPLTSATGRRQQSRYQASLEVAFRDFPELHLEYAANISRGGMFVRTRSPPPVRSRVRLVVRLPNGEAVEADAEVVHVISEVDAVRTGAAPGAGLQFLSRTPEFDGRIAELLASYEARRSRVLLVGADPDYRERLSLPLVAAGFEVEAAASGEEAMTKLVDGLFSLDLMLLDVDLPGLDGRTLLWRIRHLGGELELPVLVLTVAPEAELTDLKGPKGATGVVSKALGVEEIVDQVKRLLGR